MKQSIAVSILALGITLGFSAVAQDYSKGTPSKAQRDESDASKSDRSTQQRSAQDNSSSKSDRELAAAVRRAITGDESLSREAHNVTVDVQGGTVMLSGKVKNSEEKSKVAALTKNVPNVQKVEDKLTVDQSSR